MLGLQMLSRRHPRWHRDSLAHRPFSPSDPPIFHFHFSIFLSFLPLSPLECAVAKKGGGRGITSFPCEDPISSRIDDHGSRLTSAPAGTLLCFTSHQSRVTSSRLCK